MQRLTDTRVRRQTFAGARPLITTLIGYPIVWDQLSSDRGGYFVRLVRGSARFTTPTVAAYNHTIQIANTIDGTLRILPADELGVPVEIDLPDTGTGRVVADLVARGFVRGMSFYQREGADYRESFDGAGRRIIDIDCFECHEVTITGTPGFAGTVVRAKAEGWAAVRAIVAMGRRRERLRAMGDR